MNVNFVVSLRLGDGSVTADELASSLAMKPTVFWKVGELRRAPNGATMPGGPAKVNFSTFPMPSKAETLSGALMEMVSVLEEHEDILSRVKKSGGTIQLFVGWFIENNVVDYFDAKLLGRLSALGIDLFMDVYEGARHSKPTATRKKPRQRKTG